MASRADVVLGHVRLTHPFPSLLDGLVAAAAALAAGGDAVTAVRLGVSMVLLQASVGALNDLVDAPSDAGRKPGKPIPAGLVRPAAARWIAALAGVTGVLLAVPSGWATVGLALVLLGLGYGYDLWFKGTAWSWLPFALAIPLFPTYGWLGAAGSLPPIWAVLLPTAMLAGAALAVANAMVDVERDRAAGLASVAIRLGRDRAALVNLGLLGSRLGPRGRDPRPGRPARPVGARRARWGSGGARRMAAAPAGRTRGSGARLGGRGGRRRAARRRLARSHGGRGAHGGRLGRAGP